MHKLLIKIFLLSLCFLEISICTNIQKPKSPKKLTNKLSKSYKTKNQSKSSNKKASSIDDKDRSEKNFPDQQFLNTHLKGFDYHKSYLGGMKCENTKMEEMYMWRTNLSKAKFKNTTLLEINLMGADCSNIKFIGKRKNTNKRLECDETCFQDGTFNNTTFEESDFFDTNFTKAMFNNAEFIKSYFSDSNLSNATFNSVIFTSNQFENTNFSNATLNSVIFVSNQFANTNFSNTKLNSVIFVSKQCTNTNFSNAILNAVTFNAQKFENANFDKAVLTNITFKNICLIQKIQQQGQERKKFKFTTIKLEPFHQDKETTEDEKTLLNVTIHNKIAFVKNNQTYNNHENSQIQCTFSKKLPPLISITLLIGGLTKLVMEI